MKKAGSGRTDYRVYKRFLWSFLLVLVVPVVSFIFLFTQNYKRIYREKVILQAEILLESAMKELERNMENLQSMANYNNQLSHMQDISITRNFLDKEIKKTLTSEIVTHSYIKEICYYNMMKPDTVFSSVGTWSIDYYVQLMTGMAGKEMFLTELQSVQTNALCLWIPSEKTGKPPSLQYIIRGGKEKWWIFTLSQEYLEELLGQEGTITILLDRDGRQVYAVTGEEEVTAAECVDTSSELYPLLSGSNQCGFTIQRKINKTNLFQEVDSLQTYFFVVVALVLFVGAILIMFLTLYHGYPIKKIQSYCEEKIANIPVMLSGLEVFQFTVKHMEEQVRLLENRRRKNKLLLQILYGNDWGNGGFEEALTREGMFCQAKEYRVVVAVPTGHREGECSKLLWYLDELIGEDCEFHAVEVFAQDVVIMIVGIKAGATGVLHQTLLDMVDAMKRNAGCEVVMYVGNPYQKPEEVRLSYQEAITHHRVVRRKTGEKIVYCKSIKEYNYGFLYPHVELGMLSEALDEIDLKKADIITAALADIILKQKDNRMACVSIYYDVLNTYYRAHAKLNPDKRAEFLGIDLLEVKDFPDVVQMVHRIRDQFRTYVEEMDHISAVGGFPQKNGNVIDDVIVFIVQNRTVGDLSVSMVADYFDMSMSNLSHQFKAQTGRTVSDYITEVKFTYASELLRETDYSVSRIADVLGYSQTANFIRKFKQHFGVTPMEYRAANRTSIDSDTKGKMTDSGV